MRAAMRRQGPFAGLLADGAHDPCMKIRSYLVLMVVAILMPVIFFSAAALHQLIGDEREAALRGVQETARATALDIDRELGGAAVALRVLATAPQLLYGDFKSFHERTVLANRGSQSWTLLMNAQGEQLLNTLRPFGASLPVSNDRARLQQALQSDGPIVSNLLLGPITQKNVIVVAMPVTLNDGKRYLLMQSFYTSYFRKSISHAKMPPNWIVAIFDRDGMTIARSHREQEFLGKPVRPEILKASRAANEGVVRNVTRDGIDAYNAFTHSAQSGWGIAVGVPVKDIEASTRQAVMLAALGLLGALVCAMAMATFFGRRLVRSIGAAAHSATSLGRGETPVAADSSGVVEVDRLQVALSETGTLLMQERQSREIAEAERTRLLAGEQEARKLAEAQNRAKDEFIAMLGHELRNPLNAISNAISVMEIAGATPEHVSRSRTVLRRQSQHLTRIIDDLLDLSRLMTGKITLVKQRVDLSETVRSCVTALEPSASAHGQQLCVDSELVWVEADPTRLEQIVNNLLVNALKYTPPQGRIAVTVKTEANVAVLTVSDNGIGMSPELLPQIFDVFVQGAASIDRAQGGLGIGLTLVRRLVTLHGGSIAAASGGVNQGSTFTVRLPLAPVPTLKNHLPVANDIAPNGCRVLLIEDNQDGRQMMASMLALQGYTVFEAGHGEAGLQIAGAERPEVAVIDIGLPDIDGFEIARRLRADPATAGIGLIAYTGYGQDEDRQRALRAGFDLHLVKPLDMVQLMEAIAICAMRS